MAAPEPRRFRWQGLDRQGRPRAGVISAPDLRRARQQLQQQGLRPARLAAEDGALATAVPAHSQPSSDATAHNAAVPTAATTAQRVQQAQGRIHEKQLVVFTRQLATMLQAGLPLLQCLDITIAGAADRPLAALVGALRRDVAQGDSLHQAMARHPRHFDDLNCQLVLAAEQAGLLDTMLERIACHREKALALRGKIRSALAYPCAVVVMALVVTVVIMLWVVPAFEQMFRDFGAALPLATQLVVTLSRQLGAYGHWLAAALLIAATGLRHAWRRWPALRHHWQHTSLRLPLCGRLLRQAAIARWSRTFSTLLAAGVALPAALESAGGAAGNIDIARASQQVRQAVGEGTALHAAMRHSGVFGALAVQMAAIGEQAGALEGMFGHLAAIHEREVDEAAATLTSLMEPIIMAVLGVLIGGLVVVMYLPIFSLGSVV